jgi:hypothetical protein
MERSPSGACAGRSGAKPWRKEKLTVTDNEMVPEPDQVPDDASSTAPPASREDDGSDALPLASVAGKGPMDQSVPDVATGSTPVTRHDD